MSLDVRYKQRFQNYSKAFNLLKDALHEKEIGDYSDLELQGIIQRFEFTFELAWKTIKDYLEFINIKLEIVSPLYIIKECATSGVFAQADVHPEIFLEMLKSRNEMSHMYDEAEFRRTIKKIKDQFYPELDKIYFYFLNKEFEFNE